MPMDGWVTRLGVPLLVLAPCEGGRHYRTTGLPSSGNKGCDEMKRMAPTSRWGPDLRGKKGSQPRLPFLSTEAQPPQRSSIIPYYMHATHVKPSTRRKASKVTAHAAGAGFCSLFRFFFVFFFAIEMAAAQERACGSL
jgi:hypothetical protein